MEFAFETAYNQKALTAMAKAVRKTTRAKRSRRSHIVGWVLVVMALLIAAMAIMLKEFSANTVVTLIAAFVVAVVMIFEDSINAYLAGKRMVKGLETAKVEFKADCFVSATEVGTTEFNYSVIRAIAKTGDYIIFVLDKNHAQAYDLTSIMNGTPKEFCKFIEKKTKLEIQKI